MNNDENYNKLVKEAILQLDGRFIEFDGMNCHQLDDNECEGWDGESKGSANMKKEMLALQKPVFEVILRTYGTEKDQA